MCISEAAAHRKRTRQGHAGDIIPRPGYLLSRGDRALYNVQNSVRTLVASGMHRITECFVDTDTGGVQFSACVSLVCQARPLSLSGLTASMPRLPSMQQGEGCSRAKGMTYIGTRLDTQADSGPARNLEARQLGSVPKVRLRLRSTCYASNAPFSKPL